jgi:L-ascorbate metabolism protein UlaG (beta-lactamase superfamily)
MKITQLRNATIVLEFQSNSGPITLLVDPMLERKGGLPSLKYLGGTQRRNPLVELPSNAIDLLDLVTHTLITHCQRGHFDHLDRAGKRFLRERGTPVICMPRDHKYLNNRGLIVQPLTGTERQPFFNGYITPIPCIHGRGFIGSLMEHGHGYLIELPNEPSVYIAGDTLLTEEVGRCLSIAKPAVSILPAGGAKMDVGSEILMSKDEFMEACKLTAGIVIANHLEALDHCPTTREEITVAANAAGIMHRFLVPDDGQVMEFKA